MSILYTTTSVAKSIAEDTIKNRFAKPYNFGEYDTENNKFVMEKPIEKGIYLFTITLKDDIVYRFTGLIEMSSNEAEQSNSSSFADFDRGGETHIIYESGTLQYFQTIAKYDQHIIYLYKLD